MVAEQHVFELSDVVGTMVGFRFPDYVEGIEVGGYHLHFIDEAHERGDPELAAATHDALDRVEHAG